MLKIKQLKCGESAQIKGFESAQQSYRHKLLAMGLIPGTVFKLLRKAPLGDPIEIEIRGYHLTLRKNEAQAINISRVNTSGGAL